QPHPPQADEGDGRWGHDGWAGHGLGSPLAPPGVSRDPAASSSARSLSLAARRRDHRSLLIPRRRIYSRHRLALGRPASVVEPLGPSPENPPFTRPAHARARARLGRCAELPSAPFPEESLMTKEDLIELDGTVTEVLPDSRFRVKLDNGHET